MSQKMDQKISSFIRSQSIFTLATCAENKPYCATCYYAYYQDLESIVFKSSINTQHIQEGLANSSVGGTISPDKTEIGMIKGIQFTGKFIQPTNNLLTDLQFLYYKKQPFAIGMKGDLWMVELTSIKYTDNTFGFGNKLLWHR